MEENKSKNVEQKKRSSKQKNKENKSKNVEQKKRSSKQKKSDVAMARARNCVCALGPTTSAFLQQRAGRRQGLLVGKLLLNGKLQVASELAQKTLITERHTTHIDPEMLLAELSLQHLLASFFFA